MIVLQCANSESELLSPIINNPSIDSQKIEKSNFNGQQELIELLCEVTPVAIPVIAGVVIAAIKSKRHVVVKHKGTTIQGLSEKNTLKVLEKLIDKK